MPCPHYASELDIVLNKCAICLTYWPCYRCHALAEDHQFGPMPVAAPDSVKCAKCGYVMGFYEYRKTTACPGCGRGFNPGCATHASIYFELP